MSSLYMYIFLFGPSNKVDDLPLEKKCEQFCLKFGNTFAQDVAEKVAENVAEEVAGDILISNQGKYCTSF